MGNKHHQRQCVPSEERVQSLVNSLTTQEKLRLVHGAVDPEQRAMGYTPPIERLGIPGISMVAGPVGVQGFDLNEKSTAFPTSLASAATWDPNLIRSQGRALARECKWLGYDVLLAPPGVNIIRIPSGGRNFEYFTEDPYLNGRMAIAITEGIQSEGIIATAKHYAVNNQERNRNFVSADIDERALREVYLAGFRAAVKEAGVGSVMSAYNRVNGTYASHHHHLLTEILKEEWGFDGFVMSDWWAIKDTVSAANAGMDLEMPGVPRCDLISIELGDSDEPPRNVPDEDLEGPDGDPLQGSPGLFGEPLRDAIEGGEVPEQRLDDMVRRILWQYQRFGILAGERTGGPGALDTPEHRSLARDIATDGTVLLKNENESLPIDGTAIETVAVIGPNADSAATGGGGSSYVTPSYEVSPLAGIVARVPDRVDVLFEPGVTRVPEIEMFAELTESENREGIREETTPRIDDAVDIAATADVAIVFARDATTEGEDQDDLSLPNNQDELISAIASANDRTVVVLNTNGPTRMPWIEDIEAVLEAWYPGQEDGNAIAAILFGHVNPSGKLPVTFGERFEDYPANTEGQYPGTDNVAAYSEGIFVGYRHFDEQDIEPLFPFGHGLSYTTFEYSNIHVSPPCPTPDDDIHVTATIANVGDREGSEVAQLYVTEVESTVARPPKELKAFEKVTLEPRRDTEVEFELDADSLAFFDPDAEEWSVEPGQFEVHIGSSSRGIRLSEQFELRA